VIDFVVLNDAAKLPLPFSVEDRPHSIEFEMAGTKSLNLPQASPYLGRATNKTSEVLPLSQRKHAKINAVSHCCKTHLICDAYQMRSNGSISVSRPSSSSPFPPISQIKPCMQYASPSHHSTPIIPRLKHPLLLPSRRQVPTPLLLPIELEVLVVARVVDDRVVGGDPGVVAGDAGEGVLGVGVVACGLLARVGTDGRAQRCGKDGGRGMRDVLW
jgi:hypothetical protein